MEKILCIDPDSKKVVCCYGSVSEIPSACGSTSIYRVLNGEKELHSDGYLYRRVSDVVLDGDIVVTDRLACNGRSARRSKKYAKVLDLLREGYGARGVVRICASKGIKVSENTVRRLRDEYFPDGVVIGN